MRTFWVYIMASHSRVLYVGMTNNLERRVIEHRWGVGKGFTSRYRVTLLVHAEEFSDVTQAIAREKEIKAWSRAKKIALIERGNPLWLDLAVDLPQHSV